MIGTVLAIPLEKKLAGFGVLGVGLLVTAMAERQFAKHIVLIYVSMSIMALIPINTNIDFWHMLVMGAGLLLAVSTPYIVTRYVYHEKVISYPIRKHTWTKGHVGYLLLALVLSYLILPFWMQSTGGYANWTVELSFVSLGLLFLGTNVLGIWDELFFIVTTLGLLRRHFPFWVANLIQAVLFTAFLYDLIS